MNATCSSENVIWWMFINLLLKLWYVCMWECMFSDTFLKESWKNYFAKNSDKDVCKWLTVLKRKQKEQSSHLIRVQHHSYVKPNERSILWVHLNYNGVLMSLVRRHEFQMPLIVLITWWHVFAFSEKNSVVKKKFEFHNLKDKMNLRQQMKQVLFKN